MLEVLVKFISCLIPTISCFYIICMIIKKPIKEIINYKCILILLLISIISTFVQVSQNTGLHTLIIFCINILFYKMIFELNLCESFILTGLSMIVIFAADMMVSIFSVQFFPITTIKENFCVSLITNIMVLIISICIANIKIIKEGLQKFYQSTKNKISISEKLFIILIILVACILVYNIYENFKFDLNYILNLGIIVLLSILTILFINNKNNYNKLSNEYDILFTYVQTFEEWIEKEQLNRHEYKNQLAVLRCLTKEKKVKDKIDEILEDNINIEGQTVTNLKNLPKGGIKGLMYYKAAIAQKQKINLITDVSLEKDSMLTKLSEKEIRILCKLIGIYFDNAIEAAAESKKKNITIEVYELKDKVNFVFSNTFKKHKNMKDRNKKGISSKGEGRGNGLYFASKLISENSWLTSKQDIIDNYYIQELSIYKKSL